MPLALPEPLNEPAQNLVLVLADINQHAVGNMLEYLLLFPRHLRTIIVVRKDKGVGERTKKAGAGYNAGREDHREYHRDLAPLEGPLLEHPVNDKDEEYQHAVDGYGHTVPDELCSAQDPVVEECDAAHNHNAQRAQNGASQCHME